MSTKDRDQAVREVIPPTRRPLKDAADALWGQRSVQVAAGLWVTTNIAVLLVGGDAMPFDWPNRPDRSVAASLVDANLALLQVFALMVLVVFLTRRRQPLDLLARAPAQPVALRETVLLLSYGASGLLVGFLLARAFGWHPFGLHLAGTIHGTHEVVTPTEAIVWAIYNLVVYAVVPLLVFRRRYSALALNLRSTDRGNDAVVIVVVLAVESVFQLLLLKPPVFGLGAGQLALGAILTFLLYLAGAVLPAMIFVYAILVPRYLRLTRSVATTVILGGLTYALLHVWDAWTVFDTPGNAILSICFLGFTYIGPGMIKTVLTIRTGNAWVHVWAYHALAPHTLLDTAHTVEVFDLHMPHQ